MDKRLSGNIELLKTRVNLLFERLGKPSANQSDLADEIYQELLSALEELQVAEEELHQQVEELALAHERAELEARRYEDLFQFAPDGYFVTDTSGVIHEINTVGARLLGHMPAYLIGKPLSTYIHMDDRRAFRTLLLELQKNEGAAFVMETRLNSGDNNGTVYASLHVAPADDHTDRGLRWMARDITERRKMMRSLEESEARFRAIFESAGMGILLVEAGEKIIACNPASTAMLGGDLTGKNLSALIDAEHQTSLRAALEQVTTSGEPSTGIEIHYTTERLTRAGLEGNREGWLRLSFSRYPAQDDTPGMAIVIAEDITNERQAEMDLQAVKRRLFEGQEQERNRLAQELHDGPIQQLYGVSFHLKLLNRQPERDLPREEVTKTIDDIQQVVDELRATCSDLKPPSLVPFGLKKAILAYQETLEPLVKNIEIKLDLDEDRQTIPGDIRTALYRVYQQAMINALRHAHATRIEARLRAEPNRVVMEVRDNGVGFELPASWMDLLRQGHFGLAGISERVESIGGQLRVESSPGKGTTVRVEAGY